MSLSSLKNLSLKSQFAILGVAVLAFGVFIAVQSSQQNQQSNSHAAGSPFGDLNGDNRTVGGNVGNVNGNSNHIGGNAFGNVVGNSNSLGGNVFGCVVGNNNTINGNVFGDVSGRGNAVHGNILRQSNYPCPPGPTHVPSPTVTPTCSDGIDNNGNELIDIADPACHTDGNPNNPNSYDPNGNEGPVIVPSVTTNPSVGPTITVAPGNTSLTCSPASVDVTNVIPALKATLKNGNGAALVGRRISWSASNSGVSFAPASSQTDAQGNVVTHPLPSNSSFTTTITATFAGTVNISSASCNIQARFNPSPSINPTAGPTMTVAPTITVAPTETVSPTLIPTTTVVPGNTAFTLNLLLHGLGQGGDSANPAGGGNPNPLRQQRIVKVEVYDVSNVLVTTKEGPVNFNTTAGNFTGTIDMGTLATGPYTVKVKTNQFLRALVPGIQIVTAGATNVMPRTVMINGDITDDTNSDNIINILDYNILIGCYADLLPASSCTADQKSASDLDDDGAVNSTDYNLFLRELTNIQGQ